MVRHDPKSTPVDELWCLEELAGDNPYELAARTDKLRAHLQISQRLNEYCNQAVAEIRASLDRTGDASS